MSKDPAVLFYTSDFISGTLTMSDEQKGKYIILLCLQHQQGLLSYEDMINICKTYDAKIFAKFIKTEDKYYYNERMKFESDKRKKYSESRSKNRSNICESYDKHMENENENINKNKSKKKKKVFIAPEKSEVIEYFEQNGYTKEAGERAFNFYSVADWHDSKGNKVKNWKQKAQSVWFKPENKKPVNIVAPIKMLPTI